MLAWDGSHWTEQMLNKWPALPSHECQKETSIVSSCAFTDHPLRTSQPVCVLVRTSSFSIGQEQKALSLRPLRDYTSSSNNRKLSAVTAGFV